MDATLRLSGRIGEIGIVGVNAAIASAVFHATGRRGSRRSGLRSCCEKPGWWQMGEWPRDQVLAPNA
jgi:hypothetical protein